MKKGIRFLGLLVVTFLLGGIVLVGVGLNMTGRESVGQMISELSKGKISIDDGISIDTEFFSNLGKELDKNAIFHIGENDMFTDGHEVWQGDVKKTKITDSKINDLKLEAGGCFFQIKMSEDDAYYVEYEGEGKSQAYVKGKELYIKVLYASSFDFSNEENCFTLYVPKDARFEDADVQLGAGEMILDGLQVGEMKIELGAGQIVAEDLTVDDIKISVGAGDINLKEVKLGETKIEVGAGNCTIQGSVGEDIKAECAMGNITLKLEEGEEDFNYELECVSGNLKVGDTEYSGLSSSKEVDNNAKNKMDLQCVMGNIEVEFE